METGTISRLLQPTKVPSFRFASFTSKSSICCTRTRLMPACHSSHGGRKMNSDEREITVLSSELIVGGGLSLHRPLHKRGVIGKTFCSVGLSTYPGSIVESSSQTAEEKIGVLLLNLGGPDTLHDVQPFLFNLFADPDIIRLPRLFRFLQRPLAQLISVLRASKSKEGYAAIGGGSPLRKITDEQASALKMVLETKEVPANVYIAMRYWHPFTEEAVHQIKRDGITKLVVLPLYPQYSISTTGSSVRALQNIFKEDSYLSRLPVAVIESWYQRQGYIKSMANLIEQELHNFTKPEEVMIFFSAHGVPVSYVENAGDPYRDQMEECIFLIMKELKAREINNDHTLAYQSRVGPVQWLKPYTDEVLVELGQKGVKSLLAVPVSFVSEHIETLEEIDMSLSLPALGFDAKKPSYIEPIKDNASPSEQSEFDKNTDDTVISEANRHNQPPEPLRVMDSKISQIVEILRKHFSFIADFRHMPGAKIKISCALRFESEPFSRIWGNNMPANGVDTLPALYATVLKFSSSAPYGSIPSCHVPFLLGQPPKGFYSFSQTNSLDIIPVEDVSETPGDDKSFKAPVLIELEPRDPIPGFVDVFIETNADNGHIIRGQLHNITVGIEDMFLKAIVPDDIPEDAERGYYVDLFNALWEACGTSTSTGRETFVLKGGKGVAAISGTRSVKLLEVPVTSLIQAVERSLAPFIVCVTGDSLTNLMKEGGVIRDITWDEIPLSSSSTDDTIAETSLVGGPLYLKYKDDEDDGGGGYVQISKKNLGIIQILIFLPPRFHLLFQMEVSNTSTLVRIRTDHWPCLAYVDDYLEALFS